MYGVYSAKPQYLEYIWIASIANGHWPFYQGNAFQAMFLKYSITSFWHSIFFNPCLSKALTFLFLCWCSHMGLGVMWNKLYLMYHIKYWAASIKLFVGRNGKKMQFRHWFLGFVFTNTLQYKWYVKFILSVQLCWSYIVFVIFYYLFSLKNIALYHHILRGIPLHQTNTYTIGAISLQAKQPISMFLECGRKSEY